MQSFDQLSPTLINMLLIPEEELNAKKIFEDFTPTSIAIGAALKDEQKGTLFSKKFFPNSTIVDTKKNNTKINFKFSKNKIQLTGANNIESIMEHFHEIENALGYKIKLKKGYKINMLNYCYRIGYSFSHILDRLTDHPVLRFNYDNTGLIYIPVFRKTGDPEDPEYSKFQSSRTGYVQQSNHCNSFEYARDSYEMLKEALEK